MPKKDLSDDVENVEPQDNQTVESIRPLKMLVISMGLIMIGGTVMLAGLVWKKVNAQTNGTGAYACAGGEADLKGRGQVLSLERDGKILYVTLQKNDQTLEVAGVDVCSGKVKSSVLMAIDGRKK